MTLKEIEESNKDMLIPTDIAPILGCSAHAIRLQARNNPQLLGFPVIIIGSGVKIPREAFLKYLKGIES